jgi:isoquinoline 1-oxidoreductase
MSPELDRRSFLQLVGGGIVVLVHLRPRDALAQGAYPKDLNAYLHVAEDGRVTFFSGKIEMGQGVMTSQAQMAADELGVALEDVSIVLGDTDRCPWDQGTWGSLTTRVFGPVLRAAVAEAREVLIQLAAERLGVSPDGLRIADGVVAPVGGGDGVTLGELARGRRIERTLDGEAVLKSVKEFAVMGRSPERLDARAKVTGKARYAGDLRLPGLLRARLLRPPAHGATLRSVDTSGARALEGVVVVEEDELVAVLHEDREMAELALVRVRAQWDTPAPGVDNETIFDHLLENAPPGRTMEEGGSLSEGERACSEVVEARYHDGYVAHAPMEPHAALASVEDGKATLWISTQTPFGDRDRVARALGFAPEDVRVITPFVGGGFGGKASSGQAVEAARLALATGRPVQVLWDRTEEFFYDTFRPAAVVTIRSGMDGEGRVQLWDYHVYTAGARGSGLFYDVPHHRVVAHGPGWTAPGVHPFATGAWRAPGANTNAFARESQIDVMAAGAGLDPLELRLRNTSDARMRRVLETVAEAAGWMGTPGPRGGDREGVIRGTGLACGIDAGTYVAHVAEVAVDRSTGEVRVERVVCAQDMGIVVNPDGARMQMEGCMTMGLGYALMEDVRFRGGDVLTRNFDGYRIPRFSDLPTLETVIVSNDEVAPQGGGEPAIICMGAVIANAIFDATGARLYSMPMTPARVLEALGAVATG